MSDARLAEILRFLNAVQIRATYGAVAGILGVLPRSMGARLGYRRPEASWIVSAENGLPTGYSREELHPALFASSGVIRSGSELQRRMDLWRGR